LRDGSSLPAEQLPDASAMIGLLPAATIKSIS